MNKKDAKNEYADIFYLPHHQSTTRAHMSLYDRAAQFASYKSLSGYEDMVAEEARLTDIEIELSDSMIEMIDATIAEIERLIDDGGHPNVSVTYFKPDQYKQGGSYETLTGIVKKIDPIEKKLILYGSGDIEDKRIPNVEIPIKKISLIICR